MQSTIMFSISTISATDRKRLSALLSIIAQNIPFASQSLSLAAIHKLPTRVYAESVSQSLTTEMLILHYIYCCTPRAFIYMASHQLAPKSAVLWISSRRLSASANLTPYFYHWFWRPHYIHAGHDIAALSIILVSLTEQLFIFAGRKPYIYLPIPHIFVLLKQKRHFSAHFSLAEPSSWWRNKGT